MRSRAGGILAGISPDIYLLPANCNWKIPTVPPTIPSPPPRRLARPLALPHGIPDHFPFAFMAIVPFVRDSYMEDETRTDETEFESSQEEGAEMVRILRAAGIGVVVEFVVPEAEDGDGGEGGEVGGGGGADVHGWWERGGWIARRWER